MSQLEEDLERQGSVPDLPSVLSEIVHETAEDVETQGDTESGDRQTEGTRCPE